MQAVSLIGADSFRDRQMRSTEMVRRDWRFSPIYAADGSGWPVRLNAGLPEPPWIAGRPRLDR